MNMPQAPAPIPNNLIWAILSTIFCCLPIGIYAILQATKVDGLVAAGDIAGAQKASDDAKKYSMIAAGAGVVVMIIYIIIMFIGAAASGAGM